MALLTVCVALAVLPGLSAGAGGTGVESEIAQIKSDMSDMKDGLNTIMQTLAAMHKPDGDAGAGSKPRPTPHRRAGAKGRYVDMADGVAVPGGGGPAEPLDDNIGNKKQEKPAIESSKVVYCTEDNDFCRPKQHDNFEFTLTREEKYLKKGLTEAGKRNFFKSRQYFRALSLQQPNRGDAWLNIGQSLFDECEEEIECDDCMPHNTRRGENCPDMLHEALTCFDVAVYLKNSDAFDMREATMDKLKIYYPDQCEQSEAECDRYRLEQEAMKLVNSSKLIDATKKMCGTTEQVSVGLDEWEREQGLLTCRTMRRVLYILRVCGVIHLKQLFNREVLRTISAAQKDYFEGFLADYLKTNELDSTELETETDASRGGYRWENKFPFQEPYMDPRFVAQRHLLMIVKGALSPAIEIDTFSSVTSMPGGKHQGWHHDVPPVHDGTVLGQASHLPPMGFISSLPLMDIDEIHGPTEFIPGSHIQMYEHNHFRSWWASKAATKLNVPHLSMTAKLGDTVLFDMRIRHRGRKNKSDKNRTITYVGYVHEWYIDAKNFKVDQSRGWDAMPGPMKKLTKRLDNKRYKESIKEVLNKMNVTTADQAELASAWTGEVADLQA